MPRGRVQLRGRVELRLRHAAGGGQHGRQDHGHGEGEEDDDEETDGGDG